MTAAWTGLMIALMLLGVHSGAATYFVATDGSDANAGTNLAVPFQTLQQAAAQMMAGDTCLIRGGVYRETLTPTHSGAPGAPIIFSAYSNEVVTLDADDLVTGWTLLSNGIYQASVDWDLGEGTNEIGWALGQGCNQVFVDGTMAHEARFPDYGSGDVLHPATVALTIDSSNPEQVSSPAFGGKPENYWAGAWFKGRSGGLEGLWWQTAQVVSSKDDTITVDPATETGDGSWLTGDGVGFLWGQFQLLDGDNEWYLQTNEPMNTLYLRVTNGEDPSLHQIEMKRRNWCVDFNGQDYIQVRGLNLWGGAVRMNGNNGAFQNCQGQFLSHYMNIIVGYEEDGVIESGGGVVVNGVSNVVSGCTLFNTAGSGVISGSWGAIIDGIGITATNTIITRNLIYNTDYAGEFACSIALHGSHDVVTFNTAHDSGRDLIRPEGTGSEICFNDLYNPGLLCMDLGCIYNWGVIGQDADGSPTRIAYNWCHDNNNPSYAPLIYLDNFDCYFVVDHNVCWNSRGNELGIRINGPCFATWVYDNTLFNCADIGSAFFDSWPTDNPYPDFWTSDIYEFSASNNLYLANSPETQLVDWLSEDFRLQSDAPAIDGGLVIPGFTDGYAGGAPDLGAYESGRPAWTAGIGSRPVLTFSITESGFVTLTTSPDAVYYQLYSTTNLAGFTGWTPVTNAPAAQASVWTITLPMPVNGECYYRLQGY